MSNSKFYRKSLTFLLPILEMINEGCIPSDMATRLDISKPLISYYIKKTKDSGYVTEVCTDSFKIYELTQPGKNFLAMYEQQQTKAGQQPVMSKICRAEYVRFKVLYTRCHLYQWIGTRLKCTSGLAHWNRQRQG
jgi:predicted transcriptional regulator